MKTSRQLAATALTACIAAAGTVPATAPLAAQTPEVVVGPNLRVGPGQFNEPWIAASPDNPDFLIAVTQTGGLSFPDPALAMTLATRNNAAFLSRNGGVAWEPITLPGDEPGAFDPMVVPGPDGRMWILYCYVGANTMGDLLPGQSGAQTTARSWCGRPTTRGRPGTGPTRLRSPVPPDHARIAADWTDGPNRGRLYVVWNDVRDSFIRDDFQLFLHTLDDGGNTVSEPKLLATIPGRQAGSHRARGAVGRGTAGHLLPVLLPAERRGERADAVLHHAVGGRRRDLHRAGGRVPGRHPLLALRPDRDDERVHAADRGLGPHGRTPRRQHLRRVGRGDRGGRAGRRHLRCLVPALHRWRAELVGPDAAE